MFPNIKSFERFRVFNRRNYREMTKLNLDKPVTKFYCVHRTDLLSMVHSRYADVQLPRFIAQKMKSRWDFEYGISEKKKENKFPNHIWSVINYVASEGDISIVTKKKKKKVTNVQRYLPKNRIFLDTCEDVLKQLCTGQQSFKKSSQYLKVSCLSVTLALFLTLT